MNEEILKALGQLFAIISKQDAGVTENERQFVIRFFRYESNGDSIRKYIELYDKFSGYGLPGIQEDSEIRGKILVKDVVRTLAICRKINKALTQRQKIIVLMKLIDLVCSYKSLPVQAMEIVNTVSRVFTIDEKDFRLIRAFVTVEGYR